MCDYPDGARSWDSFSPSGAPAVGHPGPRTHAQWRESLLLLMKVVRQGALCQQPKGLVPNNRPTGHVPHAWIGCKSPWQGESHHVSHSPGRTGRKAFRRTGSGPLPNSSIGCSLPREDAKSGWGQRPAVTSLETIPESCNSHLTCFLRMSFADGNNKCQYHCKGLKR